MRRTINQYFDDPVAAYSHLAPHYADVSSRRKPYLLSIENAIASRIPGGSSSLLDIGAGDGSRAIRIAGKSKIPNTVLVEPSREMSAPATRVAKVWSVRAEELSDYSTQFDVITCLWNVLGHVRGIEKRACAMKAIGRLLTPKGRCFVDVTHRYNVPSYGVFPALGRFVRDSFFYKNENADVTATWKIPGDSISTYGHVFTNREIRRLVRVAGLEIEERMVVDYESGKIRRFAFMGNLLYILRRRPSIDSESAAHIS